MQSPLGWSSEMPLGKVSVIRVSLQFHLALKVEGVEAGAGLLGEVIFISL